MDYGALLLKYIPGVISDLGEVVTFTPTEDTAYDIDTSTTNEDGTTYQVKGVPSNYKAREIDGDLIQATDMKLLLSNPPRVPEVDDTALINNTTMRVLEVKKVRVQGSTVVYIVQLRL